MFGNNLNPSFAVEIVRRFLNATQMSV